MGNDPDTFWIQLFIIDFSEFWLNNTWTVIIFNVSSNHDWRGGRAAEGAGLLNRYRVYSSIEGSNPSPSAISLYLLSKSMGYKTTQFPPHSTIAVKPDAPTEEVEIEKDLIQNSRLTN